MDKIRGKLDEVINRRMIAESRIINKIRNGDGIDKNLVDEVIVL